jgi:hypothetical protein
MTPESVFMSEAFIDFSQDWINDILTARSFGREYIYIFLIKFKFLPEVIGRFQIKIGNKAFF